MFNKKYSSQPTAIASYSFAEITTASGYIVFYLGKTIDLNLISNNTFYSDSIATASANMGISADALRLDNDFDILINQPLTFQGKGIINIPLGVSRSGASNSGYAVVKLRKWNGAAETEICNNTSRVWPNNAVSGYTYTMLAVDLEVPQTSFKVGEYLRITIEIWGTGGADPSFVAYAHDPKNRTTGWDTTGAVPSILTALIPVRIDL